MRWIYLVFLVSALIITEAKPWRNKKRADRFFRRYLCSKWLNLPWITDDSSYSKPRISQMRTILGSCKADVGTCPVGSCSTTPHFKFFNCPHDGYICPETESRIVDCGRQGPRDYQYVTRCTCCTDNGIIISGKVLDSISKSPLENVRIKISKLSKVFTDSNGLFNATIDSNHRSIVVRAINKQKEYMDVVKIVDIPEGSRGPLNITLLMIKKSKPVQIDATVESTFSLSKDPTNANSGNAHIVINPNSFSDKNGKLYKGSVRASITFIDSNSDAEEIIPGRFLTPVGDSLENLISDGVVSFEFTDLDGNPLNVKPIKFILRKDMKLWDLNVSTGLWEPANIVQSRRKRQVQLTEEITLKIFSGRWYNIDKIPNAPKCYFKARIYNKTTGVEIKESSTASFRPAIIAYTPENQRLRLYPGYTNSPSQTCFEVRCPTINKPNETLIGFINMTSTETVSIGGVQIPSTSNLRPKPIGEYSEGVRNKLERIEYKIAPNDVDIFLNFISEAGGLFYADKRECEIAEDDQPALHFFQSEPPSYEPDSGDHNICTARIAFRDNWNFYNYTQSLEDLPKITAISVWEKDGKKFYYNSSASLEISRLDGEMLVFACMKYHCSEESKNGSFTPTTVYLDIDVPNITYSMNYSLWNGTFVARNHSVPSFYCNGNCDGPLCYRQFERGNIMSFEGSFEGSFDAPYIAHFRTDFFDTIPNTCSDRLGSEPAAYEFNCHSNVEIMNDEVREEIIQPL